MRVVARQQRPLSAFSAAVLSELCGKTPLRPDGTKQRRRKPKAESAKPTIISGSDCGSPPLEFASQRQTTPADQPASLPARCESVTAICALCLRLRQGSPTVPSTGRASAGACGGRLRQSDGPHREGVESGEDPGNVRHAQSHF